MTRRAEVATSPGPCSVRWRSSPRRRSGGAFCE